MTIRYSLIWIFMACYAMLTAQESLDNLLTKVETGNSQLISAERLMDARKLEASTGLTPANPEVEFAYLWGSPEALGNRTDFTVTQTFDFPTAYTSRNRLAKTSRSQAELEYHATRQEVMLQAKQAWITRVHLNIVRSLQQMRMAMAEKVLNAFERKVALGEADQLQLNQARLKTIALKNDMSLLMQKISRNEVELMNLTGNAPVMIADTIFPASATIWIDSLVVDYEAGYLNKVYQAEVEKRSQEVDVVFHQKLPKLKAGYYSEYILDTKLRGVQAGISIPLWENARAVRSAKARLAYAQSDAMVYWQQKENDIRSKFTQWGYLKDRVGEMEELLTGSNNESLLRKAMEAGEISLTEYYYESDFYYQNIYNLLEFKKEMLLLESDLLKIYN